ncbi:MAG: EVE domain-containing protein, partial [Hymenobacteraceae bacterium]|nr:EVE domain-containing protein [Hymenobacteraceae bacterium]
MAHWLLKSEPEAYSFADLLRDRQTAWTGVRNAQARNNLRQMQAGDEVLIYHSMTEKAVVGRACVAAPAVPDATAPAGSGWVSVDVMADAALPQPVSLATIKADVRLLDIGLVRQSRLSV